jgi:elongation factor 1-beta
MGFTELSSASGLKSLDEFLATRSYIEGFTASQADLVVLEAVGAAPQTSLVNVLRWHRHISSLGKVALRGDRKPLASYGPLDVKIADDDDIDLFGSDEEDDAENEKLKAERVAAYNLKKSASISKLTKEPKTIAKSMVTLDVKPWDDETDMEALQAGYNILMSVLLLLKWQV